MSAGLAERATAATKVLGDFRHSPAYSRNGAPGAEWMTWAMRLGQHLQQVLDAITLEQFGAESVVKQVEQIRLVLDAFDWENDDRQYALEQIDDILRGDR